MKKFIVAVLLGVLGSVAVAENCDACKKLSLKPLDLSRTPTHEELIQSGQLGGPLSPTGPENLSTPADSLLFGQAMDAWNRHDYKTALPLLKKHVKRFPNSPWKAEAELHLGCEARFNGRYAEAEGYFKGIIEENERAGRHLTDNNEYSEVARKARLRLGMLELLRGNFDASEAVWREMVATDPDRRRIDYALYWLKRVQLFKQNAESTRRCAVESLSRLAVATGRPEAQENLRSVRANPEHGFRADELVSLAARHGLILQGVKARRPQDVAVPFIAHYKFGHFVTVTGRDRKGTLTLFDPALNLEVTMSAKEFLREWSGVALAAERRDSRMRGLLRFLTREPETMDSATLREYAGGCCGEENVEQDKGYPRDRVGGPDDCGEGICSWAFDPVSVNVFAWDTPLWYQPAIGPAVQFTMSYNSIDADVNLPSFGPKWRLNYHSRCTETPATLEGSATVYMPDGADDVYSPVPGVTNTYTPPAGVFNKLTKTGTNAFTLEFPDGTVYEYGQPQGATNVQQALLSRIVDRHSNAVTLVYDGQPNPKLNAVVDALSRTSRLFYAESGFITNIVAPFGRSMSATYSNGAVATVTDMGGVQSVYSFDTLARVTSLRTAAGTVTFSYSNNWARETITATYEDGSTEILYYDGGEAYPVISTFFTDRSGSRTQFALTLGGEYPHMGAIDRVTHPDGSQVYYQHNAALQVTNIVDEVGKTWRSSFNGAGRLTAMANPNGYQASFTYTNNGYDLASVSEGGTQVLSLAYTAKRDVSAITNALNQPTRFAYDSYGRLTNITDALTLSTVCEYGPDFWLSRITRGGLTLATYNLDAKGRVTNAVGPHGISTAFEYDGLDRLTGLTLPGERSYQWLYETNSLNLQKTLDRTGRRSLLEYNEANRLTKVTAHDWSFTGFEYAGDGNITTLTDAEGNKTRFSYDTRGRLAQKTYAEGDGVAAAYTSNNLLQTFTSGRGVVTTYKYDSAGVLTNLSYTATNTPPVRMSYDSRNRLGTLIDGWGTNSISYNNLNQVTQWLEIGASGTQRFTFAYDPLGRTTNVLWQCTTVSVQTAYAFDSLGRVTNITSDAGSFGYSYTNAGAQVSRLRYPNGETATWLYDALGRMTNLAYSTGGSCSYSYDSRDQVAGRVDPSTNVYAYKYDDQGRLIEALGLKGTNKVGGYPFRYGYDRVGNRVSQTESNQQRTLTYNANNQLKLLERPKTTEVRGYVNEYTTNVVVKSNTATNWVPTVTRYVSQTQVMFEASVTITNAGTNNYVWVRATDTSGNVSTSRVRVTSYLSAQSFNYDADGNLLTVSSSKTTNEWDAENRLVRISYTNGQTRLRYDGFSRLREIAEYNSGMVLTSLTRIVWRGWLPGGELDSSNKLIRTFTFGVDLSGTVGGAGGIGGLLAVRHTNSVNYMLRQNGRGDITEVRLTNGTVVAAYTYAPYLKQLTQSNTYNQSWRAQSHFTHARSGYIYAGFRWLDPSLGIWISRDPGGEASDINLYGYCYSSPLSYHDALGWQGEINPGYWEKYYTGGGNIAQPSGLRGIGYLSGGGRLSKVMEPAAKSTTTEMLNKCPISPKEAFGRDFSKQGLQSKMKNIENLRAGKTDKQLTKEIVGKINKQLDEGTTKGGRWTKFWIDIYESIIGSYDEPDNGPKK